MPKDHRPLLASGIRDNYRRGTVGDFLRAKIRPGAALSIVSAYFTIYAFDALRDQLTEIDRLRFLFGEPRFVRSVDPDRNQGKAFQITDEGLKPQQQLQQKRLARDCADWLAGKAEIKSVKQAGFLHGKLYHIAHGEVDDDIVGSSTYTVLCTPTTGRGCRFQTCQPSNRRRWSAWWTRSWKRSALSPRPTCRFWNARLISWSAGCMA
jgi:hypothetical protein